jgi:hypothetical protein
MCALGQEVTGNIYGTVTDATGAAVANAKITVTHVERNAVLRELVTNEVGLFSATLLPLGHYDVSVETAGFKRATRKGIELNANERVAADFTLEIGDLAQEVSVEAQAVQIETQSAQQQALVSGTMVRELSLQNRHFAQLLALQPGVVSNASEGMYVGSTNPSGSNNTVPFSVNGQRNSANNFTVDGADITDRGSNLTIINYPSVDAIEEVRIVRSAYSAEFGRSAGGQISVITRSGTSQFHGSLYEFVRNDKLNANNFFNNSANVKRPPIRYNNFGYTVGGPVFIPNVYNNEKNKTFFFWSQEYRRFINYATTTATVPTAAEKRGIFDVPVCIGPVGNECSQTTQRITSINPVAQAYLQDIWSKIPEPNSTLNRLVTPLRGIFNSRQDMLRIDHNAGSRLLLSGRFMNDVIPTEEPGGLFTGSALPGVSTTRTNSPGKTLVVRATATISPTLYNESGMTWSKGGINSEPIGLANKANSPNVAKIVKTAYPSTLDRIPAVTAGFSSITGYGQYDNVSKNWNVFDNLSMLRGRHNFKFGGTWNWYHKQENAGGNNTGTFTFASAPKTAVAQTYHQAWANFLLGNVATFTQVSQDIFPKLRMHGIELYFQDDWRITNRLTLNLGARWSDFFQPYDVANLLSNFNPGAYDPAQAVRIDPVTGNIVANSPGNRFNGLIYDKDNVPTGGMASPWGNSPGPNDHNNIAPRIGLAWDVFGNGRTSIRSGYGMFYDTQLLGIYHQNAFTNAPFAVTSNFTGGRFEDPMAGTMSVSAAPITVRGTQVTSKTPYSQQWSFDLQQQIAKDFVATIGYIGSRGTNLIGIVDLNLVRPGDADAAGLRPASGYFTAGATTARLHAIRPYKGYVAVNTIQPAFDSSYHSLQMSAQKRFDGGSLINVAYTWSKALTNNGTDRSSAPQNTYDFDAEWGPAPLDRAHVLNLSYVYELPFFRAQPGVVGRVLGGWQISGITSFMTGQALTVTSGTGQDPAGLGFLGASAAGPRPDLIANPEQGSGLRTKDNWFNKTAFAEPVPGKVGNAGRGILRGPNLYKWDLSLFKNIKVNERLRFQFRAEAFNAFNQTIWNAPGTAFPGASNIATNPTFGRVTSARDPRTMQLGLKAYF